jgi:hypothetical protein
LSHGGRIATRGDARPSKLAGQNRPVTRAIQRAQAAAAGLVQIAAHQVLAEKEQPTPATISARINDMHAYVRKVTTAE